MAKPSLDDMWQQYRAAALGRFDAREDDACLGASEQVSAAKAIWLGGAISMLGCVSDALAAIDAFDDDPRFAGLIDALGEQALSLLAVLPRYGRTLQ